MAPTSAARLISLSLLALLPQSAWARAQTPAPWDTLPRLLAQADSAPLGPLDTAALGVLRTALRQRLASAAATDSLPLLLGLGRVERAAGPQDSALARFEQYLRAGGRPGLGLLELARTYFMAGSDQGMAPYFLAARFDDSLTQAAFLRDLDPVFGREDSAAYVARRGPDRETWLRRFWAHQAELRLLTMEERLEEHYRRLDYARRQFALPAGPRRYHRWELFRSGSTEYDDRGVVYVRHGPPSRMASFLSDGPSLTSLFSGRPSFGGRRPSNVGEPGSGAQNVARNITWMYDLPEGDLVFTFRACVRLAASGTGLEPGTCPGRPDFRLVESLLDVLAVGGMRAALGSGAQRPARGLRFDGLERLLLSRVTIDERYAALLGADQYTAPLAARRERMDGRDDLKRGIATATAEPRFRRSLASRTEALVTANRSGRPVVHVAFALDGATLPYQSVAGGEAVAYPLHLRIGILDSLGTPVAWMDTTRVYRSARPLGHGEALYDRFALSVAPGRYSYRVRFTGTDSTGAITAPAALVVPPTDGSDFGLSDLIVGQASLPLRWQTPSGDTAWFNPGGSYARKELLEVYYEVYGLAAGTDYTAELAVARIDRPRRAIIRVRFTDQSRGPVTRIARSLSLAQAEPGRYTARLTIVGPGGQERQRTVELVVR